MKSVCFPLENLEKFWEKQKYQGKNFIVSEGENEELSVTILDFILAKNLLSPPSIPFLYPIKNERERETYQKKVYQRKETLNMYVRV